MTYDAGRPHPLLIAGVVAIGAVLGTVVSFVLLATLVAVVADDAKTEPEVVAHTDQTQSSSAATATSTPTPNPTVTPTPSPKPTPKPRTFLVTHVVDGDTVDLANGESVRLVGIDTPETGECGYARARDALAGLVEGRRVRLVRPTEDRDRYGRLLRYVDVGSTDAGLRLIRRGLAIARYDSRDGYGFHARERTYIEADAAAADVACAEPRGFASASQAPEPGGNCEPGYSPCVPSYPPDLDCSDVGPVTVTGDDPHELDGDGDGKACGGD